MNTYESCVEVHDGAKYREDIAKLKDFCANHGCKVRETKLIHPKYYGFYSFLFGHIAINSRRKDSVRLHSLIHETVHMLTYPSGKMTMSKHRYLEALAELVTPIVMMKRHGIDTTDWSYYHRAYYGHGFLNDPIVDDIANQLMNVLEEPCA